jgi:hypothetical protein
MQRQGHRHSCSGLAPAEVVARRADSPHMRLVVGRCRQGMAGHHTAAEAETLKLRAKTHSLAVP